MLYNICISKTATIAEAMDQLNQTGRKILFVLDGRRLIGSLTDGDVRRCLLAGRGLEETIDSVANFRPATANSQEYAKKMLKNGTSYPAIPVVAADGSLVDIVFREEIREPKIFSALNLPVVIMAGGKGTRLAPYTNILPKPLIPVGEQPILEHIMERFVSYECNQFHVIVNHKKQLIKAYFAESEHNYDLHWYDENTPLGTGGGLSLLKGHMNGTFFLTNCDILLLDDYAKMLRYHKDSGNAVTMIAARKNVTIPYGVIETGDGGVIEAFREKPSFDFLTNTGMYIVEPCVLDDIEDDTPIGFPTIMEQQKAKGRKIGAYSVDEDDWLDMGQLEELEIMRKRLYGE